MPGLFSGRDGRAGMIDLDRARELVSPRVGIIRSLTRLEPDPKEPSPTVVYQATLSHFDFRAGGADERSVAGRGLTDGEAALGAIAEAVERYCAAHVDPRTLRRATWAEIQDGAIAPTDCVLYSARQYADGSAPAAAWVPDEPITWMTVRELPSGREILVPAGLVYMTQVSGDPRDVLCQVTSNGLAAGDSDAMAALHALYELVERDGFLITWMQRLPAPEIDVPALGGIVETIRRRYARDGVTVRAFDISTDIPIPVVMAIALDDSGDAPATQVALGCHLDPGVAVRKAVTELCQLRRGALARYRAGPVFAPPASYQHVRTLHDHSAFLAPVERREEWAFLLNSGRTRRIDEMANHSTGSVAGDLSACVGMLTAAGCRIAVADLTTADIASYGFRVVRAIATGLQPIHFGSGFERLGGRRLFDVPRAMGHARSARTEAELNPCPHPLA